MQWLIDTSPRKDPWSPARMVGEIMAVWFSTVHQLAMVCFWSLAIMEWSIRLTKCCPPAPGYSCKTTTYVIEDLCLHHEYIEPLRLEIPSAATTDSGLPPLLDSFVKESVRCSNADASA